MRKQTNTREKILKELRSELRGRFHFEERVNSERVDTLSARQLRRALYVYVQLKKGNHRFPHRNRYYAVQFGGDPMQRGNYIVVRAENFRCQTFITILVDQIVPFFNHRPTLKIHARDIGVNPKEADGFFEERMARTKSGLARIQKRKIRKWMEREIGASEKLIFQIFGKRYTRRALKSLVDEKILTNGGGFYYLSSLEE